MENPKFTSEQQDWICYQIGEWYLRWKDKMFLPSRCHYLGAAKEELKTLICDGLTMEEYIEKLKLEKEEKC